MNGISGAFSDWRLARGNWNFGDDAGAVGTVTLYTVTGDVLCKLAGSVDIALTSTSADGTVEVGIAGNTAALCVQDVADATAFQIGDSWSLTTAADANARLVNVRVRLAVRGCDRFRHVDADRVCVAGELVRERDVRVAIDAFRDLRELRGLRVADAQEARRF